MAAEEKGSYYTPVFKRKNTDKIEKGLKDMSTLWCKGPEFGF